ncbi:zinc finger CCCH domain-containing protein 13 isoform X2 [Epinephelus fuscoguttatus]|uniref:zinc finger CCCH domain-containing protein 13 isoform X2 n=1 Tax=Epinephelus fuscoguttatus TaxID=293821 RepID=UPI0020D06818|nr:zinc finger CCCH domain-containing protein 13 isoform X2 [Epinephelus fuscoguttatus]
MGTKRPSCTLLDTNINTSDRKLQPGGKISRDPSPRPAMTAQSERERDSNREEDWRRERETEKMRDKARYKDTDPRDRYYERDQGPSPRPRQGEREWREREMRQGDDRGRNGRPLSHQVKETDREVERRVKKGDTFPRMRKSSADRGRGMASTTEVYEERGERRPRDRPKRLDPDDWERERYRERERDEIRSRGKEKGQNTGRRPVEDEKSRKRYQESDAGFQDRRREVDRQERDEARKTERLRPNMGEREARVPSPLRRRDGEIHSDRRERRRDTRSEGDSDERELQRERMRDRERQELTYQHSRSEGDDKGKTWDRDRDRQGHRDEDRQRHRDRDREGDRSRGKGGEKDKERYRDTDRRAPRVDDRWKDSARDLKNDRREGDVHREHEQRRGREGKERKADPRWDDTIGRSSRSQNKTAPRVPPRTQSSGEWSSDMDSEVRHRRGRDSFEERESGRDSTVDSDRDIEEQRNTAAKREPKRSERDRGEMTTQRRMWLEPQRGKNSKDEFVDRERHTREKERRREEERSAESQGEWKREGRRVKEEPDERSLGQSSYRGRHEGWTEHRGGIETETEGVSVDGDEVGEVWGEVDKRGKEDLSDSDGGIEGSRQRDVEGENVTDNTEESDREEGGGSDSCARSESEGGSETGWRQERDRMLSGEESFVTLSSGGDEEGEDGEFVDCQESWEGGVAYDGSSRPSYATKGYEGDEEREEDWAIGKEEVADDEEEGKEKKPKYVICLIGQTLPRSETKKQSDHMGGDNPNIDSRHHCSDEATQQPQHDLHLTLTRNDESPVINNQNTEGRSDVPKEERLTTGEHRRETKEGKRSKEEHPYAEIGTIKRDSQTEKLLTQWREKNKEELEQTSPIPSNPYGDVCPEVNFKDIQPILERIDTGAMSPEELEAIKIRLSGAWSMSEEPKRHSQAPHLKWAKSVVREILGRSEEAVDEPHAEVDQGVDQSETAIENDQQQQEAAEETLKSSTDEQHSEPELEEEEEPSEGLREGEGQEVEDRMVESEDESQGEEPEEGDAAEEVGEETGVDGRGGKVVAESKKGATVTSSCSFRDLGPEARIRRRGIRKTTERRTGGLLEVDEEEGVGRDRRTRIFSTTDDEDDRSKSWGEVELRNVLETMGRRKRNSRFFNAAQLYQQYSEAAQNFEILLQARSEVTSVSEDTTASPAPSPPPARRPLPPLPPVPHPHSLAHTGSITSVRSLPLPERPRSEGRPSSPRLSISLTQSATLWRDLPGVRNSVELEELTEDQRRLQEVRFEVVTSEASYCRSLDIVVLQFVKSKQLGALLTTQDRNWLFSRLADVRAISHSFLSKLEERVESDMINFTVCDIIARHCQRFKMVYVPYLTNQSYQDATYQRLMNENAGFRRIVESLERNDVCQRLPLRSFLVLPFQRITRIKLLVQNIVKRTTPGTAEATQAIKALRLLEKLIQESNDSITQMKSIESLVCLSAKVDFECRTLPLISQSRRLVREGPVTELMDFSLKDTERKIYLHLFNDYLLLSLQKEGGRFTVIDHAPVSDLRVENCRVKLHSLQKNLFRLHLTQKALLLRTDTQSDKLRWISALSRPHSEVDFSAAQDFQQMQCMRAFVAQQPDELSLEKADIILVHQQSSDGWVEGTRLSDRHRGWVRESHLETITNSKVKQRNLSDALKLTTATAAV